MNEEPKSIWKKSWTDPFWFRAWLILVGVTFFIALIVYLLIPGGIPGAPQSLCLELFYILTGSLITATVLVSLWVLARRLFCKRNFKRTLFACVCLATLIALAYAEEDWRGWHAWNQFKHEWEAKGEKFDFKDFIPPPVPDSRNFAMAPIWVESIEAEFGTNVAQKWYGKSLTEQERTKLVDRLNVNIWGDESLVASPTNGGNWAKGTVSDLQVWQNYYRALAAKTNQFSVPPRPQTPAADVLFALSKYDSAVEELRQAAQLPDSRFPLNYDADRPFDVLLPHLAVMKRCSQILQLRAIAELQNGQSDKALADVKLSLRLVDSIRTEPFIISHLVRIAMLTIGMQPIYEGLAEHQWSDAQLAELDSELAKLDFLADYEFSIRGERAGAISSIEALRRMRDPSLWEYTAENGPSGSSASLKKIIAHLIPSAFFYQNELTIARLQEQWALPMADVTNRIVSPELARRNDVAVTNELNHASPYNLFARGIFAPITKAVRRFANGQISVDLARVAIALERYRLARGEYPDSLDALAPQFMEKIPHDIINGQPLHYRRTSDGQFILYSVGWNETDDGGAVVLSKGGIAIDYNKGDIVWRYPAK